MVKSYPFALTGCIMTSTTLFMYSVGWMSELGTLFIDAIAVLLLAFAVGLKINER